MADIASLIIDVDSSKARKATGDLDKLTKGGKRADQVFGRMGDAFEDAAKGSARAGRGFGTMGRGAGQAGIQVQQFVGQVQAGTNPMLALSQQAADLGIVLGVPLLGAVAGLAASLGMVLLPALFKTEESFAKLIERADDLDISLKETSPALFALKVAELEKQIRETEKAIEEETKKLKENKEVVADQVDLTEELASRRRQLQGVQKAETEAVKTQTISVEELNLKLSEQKLDLESLTNQKTKAEQSAEDFGKAIIEEVKAHGKSEAALLREEAALLNLTEDQERAVEIMAQLLEGKQKLIDARKEDAERAKAEAQATREAAQAKKEQDAEDRLEQQRQNINRQALEADQLARRKEAANTRRRIQEIENEGEKLGLLNVEQTELEVFARRLEAQKLYLAQRGLNDQQRAEAEKNIEKTKNDFVVKNTSDALNALGQINSSAFKAAKAYNIGQAIMSTFTGAASALRDIPFPFNLAAAGAVVATGLAQVATIRAQTYSGRALGGQVRGGESYVVGERGPEVLTMGSSGRITPNDKISSAQQVINKVANINFNISTVDARGFDSLLQSRRGQIVTIVNQAMNDRGTRGVV